MIMIGTSKANRQRINKYRQIELPIFMSRKPPSPLKVKGESAGSVTDCTSNKI